MSYSNHHRIKKAILNVQFPDERTAFSGQKRLVDVFNRLLLPVLEDVFNSYVQGDQVYQINHLELDLGTFDLEHLDETLIRQTIYQQLQLQWQELLPADMAVLSPEISLEETFIEFLKRGILPWQSIFNTVEEIELALEALTPASAYRIVQLAIPLLQQRSCRFRLVYQFSSKCFEWILQQLHPETAEQYLQIARSTLGSLESPESKEALLAVAIALPRDDTISSHTLENQFRDYIQSVSGTASTSQQESGTVPSDANLDELPPEVSNELLGHAVTPLSALTPTTEIGAEEWYIRNAGIVLLHPFLVRFFGHLMLLNSQREFISVAAQTKAIHMMHYLATGEERPQEHETLLYKILCGFVIEQPLIKDLSLSPEDKAESIDLLAAVIQHWTKLKNTSPDGLREGFLQRDGKLMRQEAGWKLIVEQRSIDILLDSLPWGLSMVKLPWMESMLSVDWA